MIVYYVYIFVLVWDIFVYLLFGTFSFTLSVCCVITDIGGELFTEEGETGQSPQSLWGECVVNFN